MDVRHDWQVESYRPIVKAALEVYKPEFIMELGVGYYSTSLFPDKGYIGIESDKKWINVMFKKHPAKQFIHHDLPGLHHLTRLWELTETQKADIYGYYQSLIIPSIPSLLFVDNYSCCRSIAINALRRKFDVVIFHDCQPEAWHVNGYDTIDPDGVQFLKTNDNWTGIIHPGDIYNAALPHINDFIKQHPQCEMSLA